MSRKSDVSEERLVAGYEFADFFLDLDTATLLQGDRPVHVRPQTYDVLRYLLEHHDRLVSKNEIIESVWHGAAVGDDSVTQCIKEIRKALGDRSATLIRTVPRRGFVFSQPVTERTRDTATARAENGEISDAADTNRRGWALKASIMVMLALIICGYLLDRLAQRPLQSINVPAIKSIAVLPFDDLSPGADKQYLSDGIADELLNLLARLPDLRVMSRSSSFSYRANDLDMGTVGEELDVAFVLDGSIRTESNRVRVNVYLVDTATDSNIWSETYERELGGVFDIQEAIASAIVDKLKIHLVHAQPVARRTSPEAYELYMRAKFLVYGHDDFKEAYDLTQKVLEHDPSYVPALTLQALIVYVARPGQLGFPKTEDSIIDPIQRALQIAPYDGVANAFKAWHDMGYRADATSAMKHANIALAAEPQNAEVLRRVGATVLMIGMLDESIELLRRAMIRNPQCDVCDMMIFGPYLFSKRFDDAEYHLRRFLRDKDIDRFAKMPLQFAYIGLLLAANRNIEALAKIDAAGKEGNELIFEGMRAIQACQAGNEAAYSQALRQAIGFANDNPTELFSIPVAQAYACAGEFDDAFSWLEQTRDAVAAMNEAPYRAWAAILQDPLMEPFHGDPRWDQFLESVGMAGLPPAGVTLNLPPANAGSAAYQQ